MGQWNAGKYKTKQHHALTPVQTYTLSPSHHLLPVCLPLPASQQKTSVLDCSTAWQSTAHRQKQRKPLGSQGFRKKKPYEEIAPIREND